MSMLGETWWARSSRNVSRSSAPSWVSMRRARRRRALGREAGQAQAGGPQHPGVVRPLADGDHAALAERSNVRRLGFGLTPGGDAHGGHPKLLVDHALLAVGVGGEEMELHAIAQPAQGAGHAIDQPAVHGQGPVDIADEMLQSDGLTAGDYELNHQRAAPRPGGDY